MQTDDNAPFLGYDDIIIERQHEIQLEKKSLRQSRTIVLRFPYSVSLESKRKEFKMSYNDAVASEFIRTLLYIDEVMEENEHDKEHIIEIPKALYRGVRNRDLCHFIDLWLGECVYMSHHKDRYNFEAITRLCGSLGISRELPFVLELEAEYPPEEFKNRHQIV